MTAVKEMIAIMQDYGEVVCCVGSSFNSGGTMEDYNEISRKAQCKTWKTAWDGGMWRSCLDSGLITSTNPYPFL